MHETLRKERVGMVKAAAYLGITVSRLRHAVDTDNRLDARELPKPVVRKGGTQHSQTYWLLGDLYDFLEAKR